ncbi:hypothetical protein BLNAU_9275 [Blattamonas nauphoetae]|uniref:Uncharacterized protein n=1 Tax=Blattamonas nauphoetae TaxID=2049346 RepID=A0ABQ9XW76_9EUKA|nr:hypothetical protein BLNAU_9275 [Blattamonas nauphoetae]
MDCIKSVRDSSEGDENYHQEQAVTSTWQRETERQRRKGEESGEDDKQREEVPGQGESVEEDIFASKVVILSDSL